MAAQSSRSFHIIKMTTKNGIKLIYITNAKLVESDSDMNSTLRDLYVDKRWKFSFLWWLTHRACQAVELADNQEKSPGGRRFACERQSKATDTRHTALFRDIQLWSTLFKIEIIWEFWVFRYRRVSFKAIEVFCNEFRRKCSSISTRFPQKLLLSSAPPLVPQP